MTILEMALWWLNQGINPVEVAYKTKKAVKEGWPKLRMNAEEIESVFNGQPRNLGILLGEPYNLSDVDLDTRESLWAWPQFAPDEPTTVWGRRSMPASHHLYFLDEPLKSVPYHDPVSKGDASLLELRSRKKDGDLGLYTVTPPSVHPSGEPIAFVRDMLILPAKMERARLVRAGNYAAAACLLGRYAPGARSGRHNYFLAVAGAMAHGKRPLEHARRLLRALYRILWGETAVLHDADKETDSTYQHYDDGRETTGIPHLEDVLDRRVLAAALKWLGLEREERPRQREEEEDKPLPPMRRIKEYLSLDIVMPKPRIEKLLMQPGLTLIVGPPKSGKTVLAVQMMMWLAHGMVPGYEKERALFDYYTLDPGPSFILEQDDRQGDASLKDFYKACRAAKGELDLPFFTETGTEMVFGKQLYDFLRTVKGDTGAVMVTLDSYTCLRPGRPAHVDIVKSEMLEFRQLSDLARELNIALTIIHHESKTASHLDAFSRAAGSFAVGAGVDTIIVVNRFNDAAEAEKERLIRIRGRKLEELDMVVRFEKDTLDYDWVFEGAASDEYPAVRQLEIEFGQCAFTVKQIISQLGWSRAKAYRTLQKMTYSGLLDKNGDTWTRRREK
jgi:hypothetical protein